MTRSWLLPNLFVTVFALSQIISVIHKVEHLNQETNTPCAFCINSVDNAIAGQDINFEVISLNFEKPTSPIICFVDLEAQFNFSPRAPPIA